jgi:hypothetical protein
VAPVGATLVVDVVAHGTHGHLIRVTVSGASGGVADAIEAEVHQKLDPLTVRHEVLRA